MQYVVYKITCDSPDVDHVYVASTIDFRHRKCEHKYRSKRETNTNKLYIAIRDHGGFENWTFEAIETSTCDTKFEIRARERFWFDQLRPSLNMDRPQASQEEIKLDHIENNKQNQSHKIHCDACNCEIRKSNMARHIKTQKHVNLEMKNTASKIDL